MDHPTDSHSSKRDKTAARVMSIHLISDATVRFADFAELGLDLKERVQKVRFRFREVTTLNWTIYLPFIRSVLKSENKNYIQVSEENLKVGGQSP